MNKILIMIACVVIIFAFMYPALENWQTVKDQVDNVIDDITPPNDSAGDSSGGSAGDSSGGSAGDSSGGSASDSTDTPTDTPIPHTFNAEHVCTTCGLDARYKTSSARATTYADHTYYLNLNVSTWETVWYDLWTAYENGELNGESLLQADENGFTFLAIKDTVENDGYLVFRCYSFCGLSLDFYPNTPGRNGYYNLVEYYADLSNIDNCYFEEYPDVTTYTFETKSENVAIYNRDIWGLIFTENYNPDGYADLLASTCPTT